VIIKNLKTGFDLEAKGNVVEMNKKKTQGWKDEVRETKTVRGN
jgi:hypothetical protein